MTFPKCVKSLALAPLLLLLTDCDKVEALFKPKPKPPSPYAFDAVLKMSPKAEALLKRPGSGLTAEGWYYGDAAPAHRDDADQLNRIFLGKEDWNYTAATRRIHLHGEPIDAAKLAETRDGQPEVILTVMITQGTLAGDPDNPLSCEFTGSVRVARQQAPILYCEFDTEHYWDEVSEASSQ